MRKTHSQCLVLLLCLCTIFACLPTASAVEEAETPPEPEVQTEENPEAVPEEPAEAPDPAEVPEPVTEEILPLEGSPMMGESGEEMTEDDPDAGIMTAASDYSFSTVLAATQTTNANNYLTYTSGSGKRAVAIHKAVVDGKSVWAYCAESRQNWPGTYTNYTQKAVPSSDFYQIQKTVMQLGFGDNDVSRLKQMFGCDLNSYEAYQATQIVMWAAQVWEQQWSYLAAAPGSVKEGVTGYWKVSTPSGKDKDAYNFALNLADAVQRVFENGIKCSVDIVQSADAVASRQYKITVTPQNYFGGYTAAISGLPGGARLTSSDGNVTVSGNSTFSSTAASGSDVLYVTVPKTTAAQTLTITVKVTPYVRQYTSNSAVGYLEPANNDYQTILFAAGKLSVASASKQVKVTIPRTPNGTVTITKLDEDTKKPVPGVTFALYERSGSDYVPTGRTAVSDSKGIVTFDGLVYTTANTGRYRVFEVSSDTHEVWTDRYVCWFTLESGLWYSYSSATAQQETGYAPRNAGGSYDYEFQFTACNKKKVTRGSLTIRKQDENSKPLSNISFAVTDQNGTQLCFSKAADGSYLPDTKGSAELVTDKNGMIQIKDLPKGSYLVTELKTASGGYALLPDAFSVTLPYTDDDGTEHLELTCTVINHPEFTLPATGGTGVCQILFLILALPAVFIILFTKSNHHKGEMSL